jgi:hypothetical protein
VIRTFLAWPSPRSLPAWKRSTTALALGNSPGRRCGERRGHVRPPRLDLLPLPLGQLLQAVQPRRLVPPLGHGQHLLTLRVREVGQDRDEELVPLPQAQFVDSPIGDDPQRIDLLGLGVGLLVAVDQPDRLGSSAQPAGHLLLVAAEEQAQHLLLEAVGVARVPALEGREQVLAVTVSAKGASVEGGLVDPEARLAPDVQVPDDLGGILDLDVGVFLPAAVIATAALRPGPGDLEAVAGALALEAGDGHVRQEIDVDGDGGLSINSWRVSSSALPLSEGGIPADKVTPGGRLWKPPNSQVAALFPQKNPLLPPMPKALVRVK